MYVILKARHRFVKLVTYRYFVKEKLIISLKEEILNNIPMEMKTAMKKEVINI